MKTKVRDLLEKLLKDPLKRLCRKRGLSSAGSREELLKRLVYHYHGDLPAVISDLRRDDLIWIAWYLSSTIEFPRNLGSLRVAELRRVYFSVLEIPDEDPDDLVKTSKDETHDEIDQSVTTKDRDFEIRFFANISDEDHPILDFTTESLVERASYSDSVTIVSAYYASSVVERIARACKGSVKIVLNGLGGRRLDIQLQQLEELRDRLSETSESVSIKLAFAKGIFHPKLYMFDNKEVWIGSANATNAGLNGKNEEILTRTSPIPQSVLSYSRSLWSRAKTLEECHNVVNSLIGFFRTGLLYYKPYMQLQLTVNPFQRRIRELPEHDRQKLTLLDSPDVTNESGVGAFNIGNVFRRMNPDTTLMSRATRRSVQLRSKGVETCYGYWVAEPLIPIVDEKLRVASAEKRDQLRTFHDWMNRERNTVKRAYRRYLKDVRQLLENEDVDWKRANWQPSLFSDTDFVSNRLDRLIADLDTSSKLDKLCQAFVHSEVPEIWEDLEASNSFMDSFFDSLSIAFAGERWTGTAKLIFESLELWEGTSNEIRESLERELTIGDGDWYEQFSS